MGIGVQKASRIPTCHPTRPHYGRNLCKPCYFMSWRIQHGIQVRGPHEPECDRGVALQLPVHPMPVECGKCHRRDGLYGQRPEVCCRWCGWAVLVKPPGGFTDRDMIVPQSRPEPAI